jgi:hypothetical protein
MTLATIIPGYTPTSSEVADAQRIAKRLVQMAKEFARERFEEKYGRGPTPMPATIQTPEAYRIARIADADAREYNALLTACSAEAWRLWQASPESTDGSIRSRLTWANGRMAAI